MARHPLRQCQPQLQKFSRRSRAFILAFLSLESDGAGIDSGKSEPIAGAVERQGYTRQRRACEDSCEVHISQGLPAGRCDPAFDIGAESRLGD